MDKEVYKERDIKTMLKICDLFIDGFPFGVVHPIDLKEKVIPRKIDGRLFQFFNFSSS